MVCYGWTIDYINENVTLAQIHYLLDVIAENPPTAILGFSLGKSKQEDTLMEQIGKLGDKVKYEKWYDKKSIKSVIRKRDGKRIK